MDGVHDLGGKPGFGPVDKTGEDEVFHERWEGAVFTMSALGQATKSWYNSDRFRHAVERINPEAYLTHGYYGRWLGGIETLLVEGGVLSQEAITQRAIEMGASTNDLIAAEPQLNPDPLGQPATQKGAKREIKTEPKFSAGQSVITQTEGVPGHTRLPEYARGKPGIVVADCGGWVFPDTNAHGAGEQPQYLYTVRFRSLDLGFEEGFNVHLDLFEPYLQLQGEPS